MKKFIGGFVAGVVTGCIGAVLYFKCKDCIEDDIYVDDFTEFDDDDDYDYTSTGFAEGVDYD